ncbi:MAG: SDR family oxidoreductase [Rhodobiaceae bacterium]|nr:SDR family oxidoreductase [Rhodobiaceae bacterium]MCC0055753.1 SDR family oxidoreductase [Rhodobiaceae bacterium]
MNKYDLSGRKAVITGGATGIGYATAERFLKSGADVEIWARNVKNLEAAQKSLSEFGKVTFNSVDVSDWDQVQAGAEKAIKTHGKVDILFNNAGLALEVAPMLDTSIENWKNTIAINLDSVYYCCKVFVPAMVERGYGRVINTASQAAKDGNPNQAAYSAAKAGVMAMTKSFGKELATTGVLVNCICPTVFDTPLFRETREKAPGPMQASIDKVAMKRPGLPEEAAALATWLASEDASFSTGFTFDLSGGRSTY